VLKKANKNSRKICSAFNIEKPTKPGFDVKAFKAKPKNSVHGTASKKC